MISLKGLIWIVVDKKLKCSIKGISKYVVLIKVK